MGILRTLFAISVVFAHSYGLFFVGGRNAVQLFYIISGFLMSYVLVERKTYSKIKDFYINRYLRLYPIYFSVALLALLSHFIIRGDNFFNSYMSVPFSAKILLVCSNVGIFFQDWVMFFGVVNHKLVFLTDFNKSSPPLYQLLIIPQAWTLGLELTFYIIAPFVLLKRNLIYYLLAFSIALRICLICIGLDGDPWNYRFFPTELTWFLLGSLSHQILLPLYKLKLGKGINNISKAASYFLMFITITYSFILISDNFKTIVLFLIFLLLLPFTFIYQNNNKFDKWVGDLSYPIYIGHMLVLSIFVPVLKTYGFENPAINSIIYVIISVIFSILLNHYIGNPFEKVRSKFRAKS